MINTLLGFIIIIIIIIVIIIIKILSINYLSSLPSSSLSLSDSVSSLKSLYFKLLSIWFIFSCAYLHSSKNVWG